MTSKIERPKVEELSGLFSVGANVDGEEGPSGLVVADRISPSLG